MRKPALLLILVPLLGASPAPPSPTQSLGAALRQAQADQASAEAETARLEKVAADARDEAQRLRAQQAAAVQGIEAAEARITAADAQYRLAAAYVAAHRARIAEEQKPVSSLLAGLAVMGQRPPLLTLADGGSADEFVKVSVLLDSTLPVIRNRTGALSAELAEGRRLQEAALKARGELVRSRQELGARRQQFAELERKAIQQSLAAGGQAIGAGDVAIAAGEQAERIRGEETQSQSARALASLLEREGGTPLRPFAASGPQLKLPFAYALPVSAPVVEGLGAVNDSGVRSRGIAFDSPRGADVIAPADAVVRYSGPFRDYDGIVILDHGGGWISLIVNVASPLKVGDKVRLRDPLGRAIGRVEVQLSQNGRRFSPALIAGSSQTLSKATKSG
jgi:septal ring factor EnvC (AmiA/AmiB activator)